jgi:two-component system, NarL family, response regulator NreC
VTTILVAGADPLARLGVRFLLEQHRSFEVVAELIDVEDAATFEAAGNVRVAVLMTVPAASVVARVRASAPRVAVVVVGTAATPVEVRDALRAGASAYVLRNNASVELIPAVRAAALGARYVSPALGASLVAAHDGNDRGRRLTERQCDILRLLALGHTNVEIARILSISTRTVENHRAHLQQRLGLTTRAELVREAAQRHLLEPDLSSEAV